MCDFSNNDKVVRAVVTVLTVVHDVVRVLGSSAYISKVTVHAAVLFMVLGRGVRAQQLFYPYYSPSRIFLQLYNMIVMISAII
jgi:hypothetical protein